MVLEFGIEATDYRWADPGMMKHMSFHRTFQFNNKIIASGEFLRNGLDPQQKGSCKEGRIQSELIPKRRRHLRPSHRLL